MNPFLQFAIAACLIWIGYIYPIVGVVSGPARWRVGAAITVFGFLLKPVPSKSSGHWFTLIIVGYLCCGIILFFAQSLYRASYATFTETMASVILVSAPLAAIFFVEFKTLKLFIPIKTRLRDNGNLRATNERLAKIIEAHHIPSLSFAYRMSVESPVVEKHHGLRKLNESEYPVLNSDAYHIGSCTKAFTSTLAAILVDRGKMDWTLTIKEALRDIECTPELESVSIRQLLCHRGGIIAQMPSTLWSSFFNSTELPFQQRQRMVRWVLKQPLAAPLGSYFYSNIGYTIAGIMLEEFCDIVWENAVKKEIFVPLGMNSAGFGTPAHQGMIDNPWGHRRSGLLGLESVSPGCGGDNPTALAPAGAIHCSMTDLVKFGILHTRDTNNRETLVSNKSFLTLHGMADYSFGWSIAHPAWANGNAVLSHSGSNTTFMSLFVVEPDSGFVFAAGTNCGGGLALRACRKMFQYVINQR